MCFNVTASEFDSPSSTASPTSAATATQDTDAATSTAAVAEHGSGGLSGGAKAGIAVGSIVGGIFLLAAAVFLIRRHRAVNRDTEIAATSVGTEKPVRSAEAASIGSAETVQ